jgi:hypothetical protein
MLEVVRNSEVDGRDVSIKLRWEMTPPKFD